MLISLTQTCDTKMKQIQRLSNNLHRNCKNQQSPQINMGILAYKEETATLARDMS